VLKNSTLILPDSVVRYNTVTVAILAAVAVETWSQAAAYKLKTTYFGAAAPRPKLLGGRPNGGSEPDLRPV
jgi:hypothetical protein